jgi:hypothetical protein
VLAQVSSDGRSSGRSFKLGLRSSRKNSNQNGSSGAVTRIAWNAPQTRFNCLLRRLRRIVYTRRFDIVWYGSVVALAVAAGWLVSSILSP